MIDTYDGQGGPRVIHRQYYKPYGEVALSSGSSRTSVGYTGQRLDTDSVLMFYNARFYDPVLSYFVSADTIAPDPTDSKARNRYSYVLEKYTDLTSHAGETDSGLQDTFANAGVRSPQIRRKAVMVRANVLN